MPHKPVSTTQTQMPLGMPSSTDDVNCFGVLVCFHNIQVFSPVLASLTWPQNQSYRWSMNKGPLTDLQGMSIKLECHVLSVTHSHAVLTPRWWDMTCKFVHSRMDISNICFPIKLHYSLIKGHIFFSVEQNPDLSWNNTDGTVLEPRTSLVSLDIKNTMSLQRKRTRC